MCKIEVKKLCKAFGSQSVLNDISATFESGKIYGLVGRNGSGKTVLLKCVLGFLCADSGEIIVNGEKRIGRESYLGNAGFMINSPGFIPEKSGLENLRYLASIRRKASIEDIRKAMKLVGLDPDSKKHVSAYSLGMRQKLAIAQAIMENPDILILDEPMNAIDEKSVDTIRQLLLNLREENKLIIITSHNNEDIELLCDKVLHIRDGKISSTGKHCG